MQTAAQVAWASIAVNILLSLLNLTIASASGSLAVAAEMIHNVVDLAASIAVLAGVKLSERKSRAFPYGLYKVENMVAVIVAMLIFFTAYEIAKKAITATGKPTTVTVWILGGVVLSAVIPLAFSVYELRVGRMLNSPSLMADAYEYRTHMLSSGIVFLALIGQESGIPLDRYAALAIVVFIAKTGWELLSGGMRVLLDASLDAGTLEKVRNVIAAEPAVTEVRSLVGRSAGRYRFLEAEIALHVHNLEKAHAVSQRIEKAIRAKIPHVERVLLHIEPQVRTHLCYAVPLEDPAGTISAHFGEAPFFGLITLRTSDGRIEHQEVRPNPHSRIEKAKGIRVSEWLVSLKTDVVLLRENLQGKGPAYVFADAGVETHLTAAKTLSAAIRDHKELPAG
ncbi:MAG: cation diffusion facilitator family transporter [Deltaproteobacteria bacterium]|nr:cation diffusion facilitator family transporter [Deltaproteobacteria bacterium]